MAVDPQKPRKIIVVHGTATGYDINQNQHEDVDNLIRSRMTIPFDFTTEMFRYEGINDSSQFIFKTIAQEIGSGLMLQQAIGCVIDQVGDIFVALNNSTTAKEIRSALRKQIMDVYENEEKPLYIVAHSLGALYALDVINDLMLDEGLFDPNKRGTWPVQALVTLGAPLGLSMFDRNYVTNMGQGISQFRWHNYWNRTDPIVTGSIFGVPQNRYQIVEKFGSPESTGWMIRDNVVDMGDTWIAAHTEYWFHPPIGDDLITLLTT